MVFTSLLVFCGIFGATYKITENIGLDGKVTSSQISRPMPETYIGGIIAALLIVIFAIVIWGCSC